MNVTHTYEDDLKVNESVLIRIASAAISEIENVSVYQNNSLIRFLSNQSPIQVKLLDGVVEITVQITVNKGVNVINVSEAVQKSIKENIQNMTNIIVSKVNVVVEGLEISNG